MTRKHTRKAIYVAKVTLCAPLVARSELVHLKNGDRLTGEWVRVADAKLIFRAETIGEVTIPLSKIRSFETSKAAVALLKGGQSVRGKASLTNFRRLGDWRRGRQKVCGGSHAPSHLPRRNLRAAEPRAWQNWKGGGNFGYTLVRGDRQAGTISIGFNATRRQPDLPGVTEGFRTHYVMTMLFASTRSLEGVRTSANSITTGLRQDYLFTPTNFVFVLGQLDHIEAQSLDLRQTYGAGLGHDFLRRPKAVLSFLGGSTYVNGRFQQGVARQNAEGLLGERLGLQLSDRVRVDHLFNFYPVLSDRGQFRLDSTTTVSTKISSRLALTTGFTDRYLSNPLPGHQKNELILTTGLGFNF